MNNIYLFPVDSTLKTFSVVDGGVGVKYELSLNQDKATSIAVGDILLGFVSQGVEEFRYSYRVVSNKDGALELEKEIERTQGVSVNNYLPQVAESLSALLSGDELVEVDQNIGRKIYKMLLNQNSVELLETESFVRQLITYGAPGTGKSFKAKNETKGETVFRTTFHPDSDYATFVGAYKPMMCEVDRTYVTSDGNLKLTDVSDSKLSAGLKREKVIQYAFVDQVFTKAYIAAWKYQKAASAGVAPKKVYLIIEEINRGNCAQVFGDLFQLLDRNPQGFSEYGVIPDADFGKHIGEELAKETSVIDPSRKSQINALYPEIESGVDLVDEVLAGRMLLFPDNLYIRATMNTSDQSLFPMDSAFKRRWDWDYVAIKDHPEEEWEIEIDAATHYRWWDFLEVINKEIFKATSSEDKQLGYFFARTPNKKIDLNMFVNKVVFYLWNSVFKDCYTDCEFLKEDKDHYFTFTSFFNKGVIDPERAKKFLGKLKGLQSKEAKTAASQNPTAAAGTDAAAATTDAGAENA